MYSLDQTLDQSHPKLEPCTCLSTRDLESSASKFPFHQQLVLVDAANRTLQTFASHPPDNWSKSKFKVLADSVPGEGPLLGLQMATIHVSLSGGDRVCSLFLSSGRSSPQDGPTLMTLYKPSSVPKHPPPSTWGVGLHGLNKHRPKTDLLQFCHLVSGRHHSSVARATVSLPA